MRRPPRGHRWLQQRSQGGQEAETRARRPGGRPPTALSQGPPQERPGLRDCCRAARLLSSGIIAEVKEKGKGP